MKKFILAILLFLFFNLLGTKPVLAGVLKLSLSPLPSYKNTTNFRLYYTYFETEGKTATVNLFIQKDGKDWRQTVARDKTEVSGYFQLEGSDIYDGEGKYNFYASASTSEQTVNSATVSTTLDMTPPGKVTEFGKERLNATTYRIKWKDPEDSDFGKVYLYRSKEKSFSADSGTRIGEVGGSPSETKTWDDGSIENNVEYFYALRAVDHAGNSSDIVTDTPGIVQAGAVAGEETSLGVPGAAREEVRLLPKELTPSPSPSEGELGGGISSEAGAIKTAETLLGKNKYLLLGAGLGVFLILAYIFLRRKK